VTENKNLEENSALQFVDGQVMSIAMGDSVMLPEYHGNNSHYAINIADLECVGAAPYEGHFPSQDLADFVYSASMIARKAATVLPTKAFSLLTSWESNNKKNTTDVNKLMQVWKKVLLQAVTEAACMARKYSDAYVILFFDDTDDLSQPISTDIATKLVGAVARSRWSVLPNGGAPGAAEYYTVNQNYYETKTPLDKPQNYRVHYSRVIHIPGLLVDTEQRRLRSGYNMSVYNYLAEPLNQWVASNQAGIAMLKSHSTFTMGIAGMAWKTGERDIAALKARFGSILAGIKRVGGLFFDKDQEQANLLNRSYTGVDKLIEQLNSYLVNGSDIPKEFLLNSGTSPFTEEGLGSRYAMAEVVSSYIESHVEPVVSYIFPLLAEIYQTKLNDDVVFYSGQYASAMTYTRKEESDIKFKNAQHDAIYLNSAQSVINADTVRSRWESGQYSDDLTLIGKAPEPLVPASNSEVNKLAGTEERGAYTTHKVSKKE